MAITSATAENQSLDSLSGGTTNVVAYVSLHSASPGTSPVSSPANEFSGGGYARQACSWNAASGGSKTNSSTLTFTTAGSTAASHFGTFSAVSAGTFGIGGPFGASVTATTITIAAGALTLSAS